MKLALASRVGGPGDMVETHVNFHLGAGVDAVFIAAAGGDVPEGLARRAEVQVVDGGARDSARMAAAESGADWVIESDASEFWWPRGGTLKELLEPVAPRYGTVYALARHFVPVTTGTESFPEGMIHRLAHRNSERRLIRRSAAAKSELDPMRGWFPIEVMCFQVNGEGNVYDADALRRGVEEGVLAVDTRIRDALRALADGCAPDFARTDVVEEARFAADLAALGEADVVQARERLEELEARLASLESTFTEVAKRKLRSLRLRR